MTEPAAIVTLTDTEFSLDELEAFIARARQIPQMPHSGLVKIRVTNAVVTTGAGAPLIFELSTSDEYRSKE